MQFKGEGATKFAELTDKMGKAAQITGQDQLLAIVLDGTVQSAPRVTERIDGGRAEISGKFTLAEAKNLALVLQTGALPIELMASSSNALSAPRWGKPRSPRRSSPDSIGLLLVSGVHDRGLQAPGRDRGHRAGDLHHALLGHPQRHRGHAHPARHSRYDPDAGHGRGRKRHHLRPYPRRGERPAKPCAPRSRRGSRRPSARSWTANVTALITAAVLFWAATGGVRGFALNLGIGVALSLFSAVVVSRALVGVFIAVRPFRNMKLLGLEPRTTEMKVFPVMKYRRWCVRLALGAVTVFVFLAIFVIGSNRASSSMAACATKSSSPKQATTTEVGAAFAGAGVQEPVVQTAGGDTFVITADSMTDQQFAQAQADGDHQFAASQAAWASSGSGLVSDRRRRRAPLIAILVSIIAMIGYLSWRFEYKFALPAIIALVMMWRLTLAVYAFTGRLVTTATVAAVLTILGYSINDTIIVFDRIRENTHYMKKESYASMVDLSIRQTIVRSINTAITMLIPLAAILLFGGPTLKDFAFALVIGIASGAYSSIFIASPLLVIWKEREPKYRKRAAAEGA